MACAGSLEVRQALWKELSEKLLTLVLWAGFTFYRPATSSGFGWFPVASGKYQAHLPLCSLSGNVIRSQLVVLACALSFSISPFALNHPTWSLVILPCSIILKSLLAITLPSGENMSSYAVPNLVRADGLITAREDRLMTTEKVFWSFLSWLGGAPPGRRLLGSWTATG